MFKLLLPLLFLCGVVNASELDSTNITQDTMQQNEAVNSPTSVMSNTQVNSGVTFDSYGAGVSCARATVQMGAIGNVHGDSAYNTGTQLYVGINIPFGSGSDCKDAARTQTFLNKQRTIVLKELVRRNNEVHVQEMKKKDLMYADLLAKVCLNFSGKIVADVNSIMARECKAYRLVSK